MLPLFMMKPTWAPWGASGLPVVSALPLVLTPADPENCQGAPLGVDLVGVRGQRRRLETAVDDLVLRRRQRHQVDQGGIVAALRVHADELDGVRSGRQP